MTQDWIALADASETSGDTAGAVLALQRAAAWHASQIDIDDHDDVEYARVCARLAELLLTVDRLPEAIQSYQEAVDACVRAGDDENSGRFAREILALTRQLWQRPEDRLYLLIARMEREIRQLEETDASQRARADIHFKIGTILQRRDRFEDSARHYEQAIGLYEKAEESEMELAGCHHRLAGLYQYELKSLSLAEQHYREAIRLYASSEVPYEGEQINRDLCEQLLQQLLESKGSSTEVRP